MIYTDFTESEYKEIHNTEGYYSQNGWGQVVSVSKKSAQAEKLKEIRTRKELQKIQDKAVGFGCNFTISQEFSNPGVLKIHCDKETTTGGFDNFVEWYRREILGVAYILEVI